MSMGDQVTNRISRSSEVVGRDRIGIQQIRWSIHEDHGRARTQFVSQVGLVRTCRDHDQTIDLPCQKGSGQFALTCWILVNTAREDHDFMGARDVLDRSMQGRRIRIRDVFQHQADGLRPAIRSPKTARGEVWPVLQGCCCCLYAFDQVCRHTRLQIDDPRDRLQAYP